MRLQYGIHLTKYKKKFVRVCVYAVFSICGLSLLALQP
jgi:hypothetical protein